MKSAAHRLSIAILLLSPLLFLGACSSDDAVDPTGDVTIDDDFEITDWTEATHGNSADPDYDVVFAEGTVKTLNLEISAANWQVMLDDMTAMYGTFGGGGGGGPRLKDDDNPIWVPCSVYWEGTQWYQVGVRFKGNSSLQSAWTLGVMKLPLKLDFDEFEDTYPQIDNQRFYGFKQLSLSSGYQDQSLIREKVTADIFREAGLASARSTFCRVYVDHGSGPVYFGLYTLLEIVDDTLIETQFDEDGGNLYKPDGEGASFADGSFAEAWFEKKSNEDESDWSDITSLFSALHASTRSSDAAQWRSDLEEILDVDVFLKWLAVNTVVQNWDTYGLMTHNYYLYNDPQTGLLNWIPWDNNEALQDGKMGGALPLDFEGVSSGWPLIRYLYDDEVYRARYVTGVQAAIDGAFSPSRMIPIYEDARDLVEPYVVGADGEVSGYTFLRSDSDFYTAISTLIRHVNERADSAEDYIAKQQ